MANKQRGEVTISLGGKDYTLRPTFEALQEIEDKTGLGLIALAGRFVRLEPTLRQMISVFSAGIKGADGKVPENIGTLILEKGIIGSCSECSNFLTLALSGGEEKNGDAPGDQS